MRKMKQDKGPSTRESLRVIRARKRERLAQLAKEFDACTPEEKLAYIQRRTQHSEFEVQAYLYHAIMKAGHDVRGEVSTKCKTCKFDLVVFRNRRPIGIIEVKKSKPNIGSKKFNLTEKPKRRTQIRKYSRFGIPVVQIVGMGEARRYIEKNFGAKIAETEYEPFVLVF